MTDTIFPITFVRTKNIDSSCSLCNEGILYISPQRDKSNFKCFVASNYTVVTRHSEDLMGEYVYIFKKKEIKDTIVLSSEKDTIFTIKEDDANWFYGIYDQYVIIDNGTAA